MPHCCGVHAINENDCTCSAVRSSFMMLAHFGSMYMYSNACSRWWTTQRARIHFNLGQATFFISSSCVYSTLLHCGKLYSGFQALTENSINRLYMLFAVVLSSVVLSPVCAHASLDACNNHGFVFLAYYTHDAGKVKLKCVIFVCMRVIPPTGRCEIQWNVLCIIVVCVYLDCLACTLIWFDVKSQRSLLGTFIHVIHNILRNSYCIFVCGWISLNHHNVAGNKSKWQYRSGTVNISYLF